MSMVDGDWSIDRQTGNIRYIGHDHVRFGGSTPSYATVIEFHRWLQAFADNDEYTGDDEMDIINTNPSSRSTDNIITLLGTYNIDATAAEHLYDGTIVQGTGGSQERWDGIINFGNSDVIIQLIQNGAVISDDWWNLSGGGGLNADSAQGISHRFMLKTINAGADIDGRRVVGTTREWGKTFSEFKINGTASGNNVLALGNVSDLNNQTASGTVATWTTITVQNGYRAIDVNNDTTDEYFYSEWNRDSYTINQFYERMKYLQRDGSAETISGLNGELFRGITHQLNGTQAGGTFAAPESCTWTGGSGQILSVDHNTAGTKVWIQVLTGVAPTSGTVTAAGGATFTVSGNTERAVSTPFCGQSTGSALIGAYGFGVEYADLSTNDRMVALDGNTYQPPNNVTWSIGGLVSGEDRVLVGPWDGTTYDADGNPEVDYNQFTHSSLLNGGAVTSITVGTAIPSDTPATGTIRVETDTGKYKLCVYTSWSGSVFTITSEDFSTDTSNGTGTPKNVFITYIDKLAASTTESFTSTFSSTRNLVVKVRDGGGSPIKEYITGSQLTSTGGGVTAIRTSDT